MAISGMTQFEEFNPDLIKMNVGILLDVSSSMKPIYEKIDHKEARSWIKSVIQILCDIFLYSLPSEGQVFALAFGGRDRNKIFDMIGTLKKFKDYHEGLAKEENVKTFLSYLAKNGARATKQWVKVEDVTTVVNDYLLNLVLKELKSNSKFKKDFVQNILPPECRNWESEPHGCNPCTYLKSFCASYTQRAAVGVASRFRKASKEEIKKVYEQTRPFLLEHASSKSLNEITDTLNILQECERNEQIQEEIEPFTFGDAAWYKSLEESAKLFSTISSQKKHKVLFVISGGSQEETNKEVNTDLIIRGIKDNAYVVSCFMSESPVTNPKRLYSKQRSDWSERASLLFNLSSTVPAQLLPRLILKKRGWHFDIKNNEIKLFVEVNHPKNVREAFDLFTGVLYNQDSLSEFLVRVSLDADINRNILRIRAPKQKGGTCYANACATVLHLSMKRIVGRDDGYPDFETLRKEMIDEHGIEGANTYTVLEKICRKYRLHCQKVTEEKAKIAIVKKRPVVATFRLTSSEWDTFIEFYEKTPLEILTKKEINLKKREGNEDKDGHAVVLTSFNSQCLRLMNSWGDKWGDMGFFRVKSADVLDLKFIDVYWSSNDLSKREKKKFQENGSGIAEKIMNTFTGLNIRSFKCPLKECGEKSLVKEFRGTLTAAVCPQCKKSFSIDKHENETGTKDIEKILALNMYLISLAR